jgi:hypothetical protein
VAGWARSSQRNGQPMYQTAISLSSQACQQAPDVPVCQPQALGGFDSFQMTLFDFVQHLQSLSFLADSS